MDSKQGEMKNIDRRVNAVQERNGRQCQSYLRNDTILQDT